MTSYIDPVLTESLTNYIEQFTNIAKSGVLSLDGIQQSIAYIKLINISTINNQNITNSRNSLLSKFQNSYNIISTDVLSMESMRESFVKLAEYVQKKSGLSLSNYMRINNITAPSTFAQIMQLAGIDIDASVIV